MWNQKENKRSSHRHDSNVPITVFNGFAIQAASHML